MKRVIFQKMIKPLNRPLILFVCCIAFVTSTSLISKKG